MTSIAFSPFLLGSAGTSTLRTSAGSPTVAIITRTKNRPLLLIRALASVTNQTFDNWHLYVVNDGGDPQLVEEAASPYLRIHPGKITLIHNEISVGMESASNVGLSKISQEYFVIHDDDDSWHPKFLEHAVFFLEQPTNNNVAVVTDVEVIYEEIRVDSVVETHREKWGWLRERIDFGDMLVDNSYPPISMLVRASALHELKGFNPDLPVLGDWEFNIRLMALGDIGRIKKTLAYYHHRPSANQIYGNSVHAGSHLHSEFRLQLKHELLRRALKSSPDMIGIIHLLMSKLVQIERLISDNLKTELSSKLQHIHWDLNNGKQADLLQKLQHLHWDVNNSLQDRLIETLSSSIPKVYDEHTSAANPGHDNYDPHLQNSSVSHLQVSDIAELFFYDHADFVNAVYFSILKRAPDLKGLRYYLGRLGMGYSKASIIDQIARSQEAMNNLQIAGLPELMRREARLRSPLMRFFA